MNRRSSLLVFCMAVPALVGACATGSGGNWELEHVVVHFDHSSIKPVSAEVAKGGHVRWVNSGDDIRGRVVFPQSIASSFTCDDLGPTFESIGGGYVSQPIEVMGGSDVALPCPLVPGSYDYEILIYGSGLGSGVSPGLVQNRLQGKLVVQ